MSIPNPGSREAGEQGCICPVMDNWRGSDEIGRIRGFIVVAGCPLHHQTPEPVQPNADSSAANPGAVAPPNPESVGGPA